MRIGKLPLLAALVLLAGGLAFEAAAVAQDRADNGQSGATGELPQSRSPGRRFQVTPLPPEPPAMDELDGGEEDAPDGATCPDRGNTLELII